MFSDNNFTVFNMVTSLIESPFHGQVYNQQSELVHVEANHVSLTTFYLRWCDKSVIVNLTNIHDDSGWGIRYNADVYTLQSSVDSGLARPEDILSLDNEYKVYNVNYHFVNCCNSTNVHIFMRTLNKFLSGLPLFSGALRTKSIWSAVDSQVQPLVPVKDVPLSFFKTQFRINSLNNHLTYERDGETESQRSDSKPKIVSLRKIKTHV